MAIVANLTLIALGGGGGPPSWSGACAGTNGGVCTVLMDADKQAGVAR